MPLRVPGTFADQLVSFVQHLKFWGPIQNPPAPDNNKIAFMSAPAAIFLGLDGYPGPLPESCLQYMVATLPRDKISVTTMHKVPTYFDNNRVTPATFMKDYQIRYQSVGVNYFTLDRSLYNTLWTNTNDAVYTSDGEWTTVFLPGDPQLSRAQTRQVRRLAEAANLNVIQMPPPPTGPIAKRIPYPSIAIRQKAISSSFPYSNLNLPCWSEDNDYRDWTNQDSPAFFRKYSSNRINNGPYYTDGEAMTFEQFMSTY